MSTNYELCCGFLRRDIIQFVFSKGAAERRHGGGHHIICSKANQLREKCKQMSAILRHTPIWLMIG